MRTIRTPIGLAVIAGCLIVVLVAVILRVDTSRAATTERPLVALSASGVRLHYAPGDTSTAEVTFLVTNQGRGSLSPHCVGHLRGTASRGDFYGPLLPPGASMPGAFSITTHGGLGTLLVVCFPT